MQWQVRLDCSGLKVIVTFVCFCASSHFMQNISKPYRFVIHCCNNDAYQVCDGEYLN